jgi:hypothetical protein
MYLSFDDRHRFVPGPASNFHVDADPDSEWHQDNADPHADPTSRFTHVGKILLKLFF